MTGSKPWRAMFRLLERDERLFAVLLAVVMVGGLATLGLVRLRPRYQIQSYDWIVFWFAMYKVGVLALVTVNPRNTRWTFVGALGIDVILVFALLILTGGGDSTWVNLFYPLVVVNAYYFGKWMGLVLTAVAGALYWTAGWLAPPQAAWTAVVILMGMVGLPAYALGHVADRERRARVEVERLNVELTGTLSRLQAAQQELLVAERMATVGRLSLKVAHEVRNPISAIELNAELLRDLARARAGEPDMDEAAGIIASIQDQVKTLDGLTEEYLQFARFPRPNFEEESVTDLVEELAEFVRPLATRQGLTVRTETDRSTPMLEIDRGLLRQAILNLVKNGMEVLSRGGEIVLTAGVRGTGVDISVADSGPGIDAQVARKLFEPFFTTKTQGTGLGLSIARQISEALGGELSWKNRQGGGAMFTIRLPIKRVMHV
ncbi:MAG TPA: ATP-binding protein [Candidatus Acidoferrum sp.]|nr:ATP-binding protein [Candidatus Acidoferrum sp.]